MRPRSDATLTPLIFTKCTRTHAGGDIEFALTLFPETSGDGDPKAIVLEEKHRCSANLSAIKGMIAIGERARTSPPMDRHT